MKKSVNTKPLIAILAIQAIFTISAAAALTPGQATWRWTNENCVTFKSKPGHLCNYLKFDYLDRYGRSASYLKNIRNRDATFNTTQDSLARNVCGNGCTVSCFSSRSEALNNQARRYSQAHRDTGFTISSCETS